MSESAVRKVLATKLDHETLSDDPQWVSVEEPLEIHLIQPNGDREVLAITMRTPGNEYELAVGFLLTEAIVRSREDLGPQPIATKLQTTATNNVCAVALRVAFDASSLKRNFYGTSSCGVCGKASIDHLEKKVRPMAVDAAVRVSSDVLRSLPGKLRSAQEQFSLTGGLHAVGIFDFSANLLVVREDVGRHNAMDKAIGAAMLHGLLSADLVAMASGRLSFELVQKAALAGISVLCGVSAPSSLAISAAERFGMTLVGFVRDQRLTVFSHSERVAFNQTKPL